MKKRIFIVHGWGGSNKSGWKPWLKSKLEKLGFEVHLPQMPNPNYPKREEWLSTLAAEVGKPDANCYFVGHSLGAVTIPLYIEGLKQGETVGGAVLVAGFSDSLGIPEIANFFTGPFDYAKMRQHCGKFISINSDNDRYVDLKYGYEFERELGAKLVIKENHGHFSSGEGFLEVPFVLEAVLELAGDKG
jgi:predicted alpha/beta hydrolase family esterase